MGALLTEEPEAAIGLSDSQFVCESAAMIRLAAAARRAAMQPSTILLLGQTGTGKEMLARYIHAHSSRAGKPFVPVDCSALPETLFESELFGHVRGAFSGAIRDSLGFIRAADGGTLFLDEIGELPLGLQPKLLRVVEERSVVPVGDTRPRPVDIRIICATHRDLSTMVAEGAFREDLYFRLNVLCLSLPPLRERPDDVIPLASSILQRLCTRGGEPKTLSHQAMEALLPYPWPGNIRELFNVLEHAFVFSEGSVIEPADLPPQMSGRGFPNSLASDLNLDNVERGTILEALRRARGNRPRAARLLGIETRRLNRRMEALNIHVPVSPGHDPD